VTVRVDSHQHYWHFDPVRDAWIDGTMPQLQRDFLPTDVAPALAAAGIDAVVAVQADQSEKETDFLLDLAARHPMIRGVVGWTDLRASDLDDTLTRRRTTPALKGFRHIAQAEPDDFLTWPDVMAGVRRLGDHGFTYDILIHARQLLAAERLVAACPDVQFVLDHCAKPPIASGDLAAWRVGLTAVARHAHVTCKVSGLITEAHWTTWTREQIEPCLDAAAEAFGPERLMFGSDWPVCLLAGEYARVADLVETWALRLTASERRRVFGGTAAAVYRLEE
jgi:L-fuconolactonase